MSLRNRQFRGIRTEGGLLPQDLLSRIQAGDNTVPGLTPETYHLSPHERIGEAVNRSWSRLTAVWASFRGALAREPESSPATALTRERWLLPLFGELGYGRLQRCNLQELDGRTFPVSHVWQRSPIHLLGCRVDLDHRQPGVAGAAKSSPHGLVQEFLNRSEGHRWGFVSNGLQLRVLRDHRSLTRQAYVEFDLEEIMEGEQYSEFFLLWLVCHQSRVEADNPDDCWLEIWFNVAQQEGVRALDKLRGGVERAIEAFGTGFLTNKANTPLRAALESGQLHKQEYYRQLLRLVYRLIFLFVVEERDALLDPEASEVARDRYIRYYAPRRLRELAERRRGGPHGDLWQGLRLVMDRLDGGCADLGLPALGGHLWSANRDTGRPDWGCPWLMDASCSNDYLLDGVRCLSNINDGRTRYSVNWRNVGAEELGSIYESLLELHPRINKEAGTFELNTAAGHERKTTGSYYTPTALVDGLLQTGLDPLLDEAVRKPDPERTILDLKICDPACGSGHFLVAAARRIAKRLASVRAGEGEPSPSEVQHALRQVVGRCIYGVDLNPMAVELCKVSLWMEAVEPGRPLSFLDSHIRSGNALIGATPELMTEGIPDIAWSAVKGDDTAVAARLKKRNQTWRQIDLFQTGYKWPDAAVATAVARIEATDDMTRELVAHKESDWQALEDSASSRKASLLADMWCAAFMWPKVPGDMEKFAPLRGLWEEAKRAPGSLPLPTLRETERLARQYSFFHWHLAFPTVAERGGFDLILGNPPWDKLSPDQREFFGQFRDGMRSLSPDEQKEAIEELLADEGIARAWEERCRHLYSTVHFLKNSGRFTLYSPGNLGKGDFNVYRTFAELALKGVRSGGYAAQIAPAGLYGGANASAIRKFMLDHCQLTQLFGLINTKRGWFSEVDIDRFCAYVARRGGRTGTFHAKFGLAAPADLAVPPITVDSNLIRQQDPDTYAIPDVRNASDITTAEKMHQRYPAFGDEGAGPPIRHYQAELHMGNDRDLFTVNSAGLPVYEGRMVDQFDHRAKTYESGHGNSAVWNARGFGDPAKAIVPQWRVLRSQVPAKLGNRVDRYRIGFGDVANPRNVRSLVATLIPPGAICGDKVPTLDFGRGNEWAYLPWLTVANSFCMDWLVRSKLSSPKLSFTLMDSLPYPRPKPDHIWVQRLAPLALRLLCTAPEMTAFWNAMAEYGWCTPVPLGTIPPSALIHESQRAEARAEIDAVVARDVFGITRDELSAILDTFPVLQRREVNSFGEYRTKRLVLMAFDEPSAVEHLVAASRMEPVPSIVPHMAPELEAMFSVMAFLHASEGVISRADLARAFALRTHPEQMVHFAPTHLAQKVQVWVQLASQRSLVPGNLTPTLAALAARSGVALTTDDSARSIVTTTTYTLPQEKIDSWFLFEARLTLQILSSLTPQSVQDVDATVSGDDRKLLKTEVV